MARRSASTIPAYKRRRQRSLPPRIFYFLVKLVLAFILFSILWVLAYRFINPPITITMLGDIFAGRGADRDWMSIDEIDRDMVRAAIAAEDSKFCSHDGFDLQAIEEAAKRNASGGRIRGGSTISQQTAKNAFLWQGGGYARKGMEAWFTLLMELTWDKRRIMEVYLNLAETGIGTYGVNAGAKRYFGHDASALTRMEAARIAAVLPLPKNRAAVSPKGFTRRYGSTISARIGVVARDGLDACVYRGGAAPVDKAPPRPTGPRTIPGEEYERPREEAPEPAAEVSANAVEPAPTELQPVLPEEPANMVEPANETGPPQVVPNPPIPLE